MSQKPKPHLFNLQNRSEESLLPLELIFRSLAVFKMSSDITIPACLTQVTLLIPITPNSWECAQLKNG